MRRHYFPTLATALWLIVGTAFLYLATSPAGGKGGQALLLVAILSYAMSVLCFCASPRHLLAARTTPLPPWNHAIYEAMAQRIVYDAQRHRERHLQAALLDSCLGQPRAASWVHSGQGREHP